MKLPDGKIGRYKIFFLVDFGNIAPISLLANHGDPVGVFGPNPLGFRLSLLWIRTVVMCANLCVVNESSRFGMDCQVRSGGFKREVYSAASSDVRILISFQ